MRWGHSYEAVSAELSLLQWVLQRVISGEIGIATCMNPRLGAWLDYFFKGGGGAAGDPDFEIYHVPASGGLGSFEVYASDEFSGIGLERATYPAEEVVDALTQLLVSYGATYPKDKHVIDKILARMPAYREQLRS